MDRDEDDITAAFQDAAAALAVRVRLDELLLDALATPGLGEDALARLETFLRGERLERGRRAWSRLSDLTPALDGGAG